MLQTNHAHARVTFFTQQRKHKTKGPQRIQYSFRSAQLLSRIFKIIEQKSYDRIYAFYHERNFLSESICSAGDFVKCKFHQIDDWN